MLKNILKIVFLGLVGFGLLVYFTAEKPKNISENVNKSAKISLSGVPASLELVGKEKPVSSSEVFKAGQKTLLVVGNHDSLIIVKDLKKYFETDLPYVLVANISKAPWFIKKWVVSSKLEELNDDPTIPMIFDFDGSMVASLNLDDTTKTSYFAYIIDENGDITNIYNGKVKEEAMDGSMNEEEKKASLKPLVDLLN